MSTTETSEDLEAEKALAVEAVLNQAATLGTKTALQRFGASLTATEKEVLSTLSDDEVKSLAAINAKLAGVAKAKPNNNNNNNNKK